MSQGVRGERETESHGVRGDRELRKQGVRESVMATEESGIPRNRI